MTLAPILLTGVHAHTKQCIEGYMFLLHQAFRHLQEPSSVHLHEHNLCPAEHKMTLVHAAQLALRHLREPSSAHLDVQRGGHQARLTRAERHLHVYNLIWRGLCPHGVDLHPWW